MQKVKTSTQPLKKNQFKRNREINNSFETRLTKSIEKGVINALKAFGADMDNQQEVQKDFHYLRKLRQRAEDSGFLAMRAIISIIIGAMAVLLWEGVKILS